MALPIQFISLTQEEYDNLDTVQTGKLYFTSDTNKIYNGDKLYSSTNLFDIKNITFQNIVSNDDTSIPMVIQLDANNPIVIFDEITSSLWNISADCNNMDETGAFTWELMFLAQHDITSISYDSDITYVGPDKDDVIDKLKLIDNQPTYHVFAFRILHRESNDYKTINYCYSFKK